MLYVFDKKKTRVFLLPTLCAVKSSDFARTNESIFICLVLDFKVPLTPCNGIGNLAKILFVESGILGFGVQNTSQGIRTPTND